MNKIKVWLLLVVMITGGQRFSTFGQAVNPFTCTNVGMIITHNAEHSATSTTFSRITIDTTTHPGTMIDNELFTIPDNINASAYNPVDGFIYTFEIGSLTRFYRVDVNGHYDVLTAVAPTGHTPANNAYKGACCNSNGILYLTSNGASDSYIYSSFPPSLKSDQIKHAIF